MSVVSPRTRTLRAGEAALQTCEAILRKRPITHFDEETLRENTKTCAKLCHNFEGFISEKQLINVFTLTSTQLMTADVWENDSKLHLSPWKGSANLEIPTSHDSTVEQAIQLRLEFNPLQRTNFQFHWWEKPSVKMWVSAEIRRIKFSPRPTASGEDTLERSGAVSPDYSTCLRLLSVGYHEGNEINGCLNQSK